MIHFDEFFGKFPKTNKNEDISKADSISKHFIEHIILLDTHTNKIQFRK